MRHIPLEYAKPGNFLGQTLYNTNGQILLAKGTILTDRLISKIIESGFMSIYISDDDSEKDTIIEEIIKPEIRQKAITSVKKIYQSIANVNGKTSSKQIEETIYELKSIANSIVDDVLSKRDIMIQLVDIKNLDDYTYSHSVNVAVLSLIIGISYNLNRNDLNDLTLGGLLHDIGKMFIPETLIKKAGKLTDDEFELMKEHSLRGYTYMRDKFNINGRSRIVALQHHERIDGTGYPHNLKGDEIHLFSRITTIADVYDSLTSDRVYRKAVPVNEVLEYIMGGCGSFFDHDLVNVFIKNVIPYPIGTFVKLSNDTIGVVEDINLNFSLRPTVKIIREQGRECSEYIMELTKEQAIVIEKIVYNI